MNTDEKFCEERFLYELKMTVKALIRGKLKNDRIPINSLIPSKKRCSDNDDSDRFSELTDLEEWTNPYVPKTPPRELKLMG